MSRYTTLALAPFDGKYMTSYVMAIIMFASDLTIYEIFAKHIKCKTVDLENELRSRRRKKRDLTGNVRSCIVDFLRISVTWTNMFAQKELFTNMQRETADLMAVANIIIASRYEVDIGPFKSSNSCTFQLEYL